MKDQDYVSLGNVTVLRTTEKALLCRIEDDDREVWVPLSQIAEESDVSDEGDEGELLVASWWAEREGLA